MNSTDNIYLFGDGFDFSRELTKKVNPNNFYTHIHTVYEFYYFISGKGIFHIEGTDYKLTPGDILIMADTESHYVEISPDVPYERCVMQFDKKIIDRVDKEGKLLNAFTNREPGQNNLFTRKDFDNNLYLSLINNFFARESLDDVHVLTNFYALLNELSKAFSNKEANKNSSSGTLPNKIIHYISNNLSQPFTLDDICREFFISKAYLCRLFKNSIGCSVLQYITSKRMILANKLIDSGLKPTEVYTKCGFYDYSSFYRVYKKYYQYSPSERKEYLNDPKNNELKLNANYK